MNHTNQPFKRFKTRAKSESALTLTTVLKTLTRATSGLSWGPRRAVG